MFLVYKRFAPRIRGLVKSKALHEQIKAMEQLIIPMKINKDQIQKQIEELRHRINQLIDNITVKSIWEIDIFSSFRFQNTPMTGTQIETSYNDLFSSIDRETRRLKQILVEQQMKDEEERLKKIQVKKNFLVSSRWNVRLKTFQNELQREKTKNSDEEKRFEEEKEEFHQ